MQIIMGRLNTVQTVWWTILRWWANIIWWAAWLGWRYVLVPIWHATKRVVWDVVAKKVIWAPLKRTGNKLLEWVRWLWGKWKSVVNTTSWALRNVFNTGTAKTSELATKTWWLLASTLKATIAAPGKAVNHVINSTKEWIDLIFNLPDHLANAWIVKNTAKAFDDVMGVFDKKST